MKSHSSKSKNFHFLTLLSSTSLLLYRSSFFTMPIPSSNTSPITSTTSATYEICDKPAKKCTQSTDAGASSPSSASSSPVFSHHDSSSKQQKQHRSLLSSQRNTDSSWTDLSTHRLRNSQLGNLYAGSRFTGSQKCGDNKYDVVVDIQVGKT